MLITWLGQSCFKIQVKNDGQEITIVTDPFEGSVGLRAPSLGAEIVTVSHDHYDHNNLDAVRGTPFVVNTPGEYETKGVFIYGIPSWHDKVEGKEKGTNTIYRINAEDLSIVHLGDLGQATLTEEQKEKLSSVDVLLIPVGGGATLDGKDAAALVAELEPRIVIPMHYKIPGLKIDLDGLDKFIKNLGLKAETTDKLRIAKKDLPQEETKLYILTP
ncbi:MAG: MBL fold metallo-hydrolase [Candidatus Buchananbacteria bacterium]